MTVISSNGVSSDDFPTTLDPVLEAVFRNAEAALVTARAQLPEGGNTIQEIDDSLFEIQSYRNDFKSPTTIIQDMVAPFTGA